MTPRYRKLFQLALVAALAMGLTLFAIGSYYVAAAVIGIGAGAPAVILWIDRRTERQRG